MQELKRLWDAGAGNKAIIVASGLLMVCGCCMICFALSAALPKNSSNSIPARNVPTISLATDTPIFGLPSAIVVIPTTAAPVVPTEMPTAMAAPTMTTIPTTEAPVVVPTEAPPVAAITLIDLTSPVSAGGNATLRIQTEPGTTCYLAYATPSGNQSKADGLGQTTADGSGICSWTWEIGPGTSPGTGRLRVTVDGASQTFEIVIE